LLSDRGVPFTLAIMAGGALTSWVRRVAIWTTAITTVAVVGFSRDYLSVHWPTDVLAGATLGTTWAAACAIAVRVSAIRTASTAPIT